MRTRVRVQLLTARGAVDEAHAAVGAELARGRPVDHQVANLVLAAIVGYTRGRKRGLHGNEVPVLQDGAG